MESGKGRSAEQKKSERCPLLYEWHKKQYVGAAHGLAGIYYMLMQVTFQGALHYGGLHLQLLFESVKSKEQLKKHFLNKFNCAIKTHLNTFPDSAINTLI